MEEIIRRLHNPTSLKTSHLHKEREIILPADSAGKQKDRASARNLFRKDANAGLRVRWLISGEIDGSLKEGPAFGPAEGPVVTLLSVVMSAGQSTGNVWWSRHFCDREESCLVEAMRGGSHREFV